MSTVNCYSLILNIILLHFSPLKIPNLKTPINRNILLSLQVMCTMTIASNMREEEAISELPLPIRCKKEIARLI
jgi:hypothetical protein